MLPGDWERFTPDSDIAYAGAEFNCFDESALALALRLKEGRQRADLPVFCSAVTAGRRPPAPFSQTLFAQGFDEVAVLEREGAEFAPRDVASLLAGYIKEEGFDLVLTGSVAGMADSGTVPFWLANILNWPVFTEAQDLEYSAGGLAVTRQNEAGLWRYLVRPPVVLTIGNSFALLQTPTLKARLAARERKPRLLTAAGGTPPAATTTLGFAKASAERSCRMMAEKEAKELAQALLSENLLQIAEELSGAASPKNGFVFPEKTVSYLPQLREGLLGEGAERQLAKDWLSRRPALAVLPQTPEGTLLATGLAARTGAALFTEAALLGWEQGRLMAQKRACAANVHWRVSLSLPAVVTLPRLPEKPPRITLSAEGRETPRWLAEAVPLAPPSLKELQNRRLIIICGLGMGSAAACERARLLAKKLGAGFGLTRPAALEGWGRVDEIVGDSGVTITPEVSLVLGASGAGAFMSGLETVSRIVAVNIDKQALIFKQADIGLLADAPALVEALLRQLEKDR